METKTLIEGIAVGAVAGAIAGLLLGSKAGQEARDEIQAELVEIRDQIVERLQTLQDFTQAKYDQVVKAVIAEYAAANTPPPPRHRRRSSRRRRRRQNLPSAAPDRRCARPFLTPITRAT
jgi:YtxH-like protein